MLSCKRMFNDFNIRTTDSILKTISVMNENAQQSNRPFRNFRNDYVIVTCCHQGMICLSREQLALGAVTSETDRLTDLKEAKFTEFVSSSYCIYFL